jgi:group I intron endonuclease
MKKRLNCGIYKITCLLTGDFYIGQSVDLYRRRSNHFTNLKQNKHFGMYIQNAYNKYGEENFKFEVLLYCEPFELTRYEQVLVDLYKPAYNSRLICVDSGLGTTRSEETKQKQSKSLLGHVVSEETKQKISIANSGENHPNFGKPAWNKGLSPSEETRQKISEAQTGKTKKRGYHLSEETRQKMSISHMGRPGAMLGKCQTEETKQKISNTSKGRIFSEEHKRKIGEANTGRIVSEETKHKLSVINMGRQTSWLGKHHTEESKQKMSLAKIGKPGTPGMLGKHHSEETKKKMAESQKKRQQREREARESSVTEKL